MNPHGVAKQLSEGAVKGSMQGVVDNPRLTDQMLNDLLRNEGLRLAVHDLAKSGTTGVGDGLTEVNWQKLSDNLGVAMADSIRRNGPEMMQGLMPEIRTQMQSAIAVWVREGLQTVHENADEDIAPVVDSVVHHAMQSFAAELAGWNPSNPNKSSPESSPLHAIMRSATSGVMMGLTDGLSAVESERPHWIRRMMREIGVGVAEGVGSTIQRSPFENIFVILALVLAGGAVLGMAMLWRRYKMTTDALALLTQKLDQGQVRVESTPSQESPPDNRHPGGGRFAQSHG